MTGKFYMILFDRGNGWEAFDEGEYTEKEANRELRHLKEGRPDWKFRKKCVYNGPIQRLSIHH